MQPQLPTLGSTLTLSPPPFEQLFWRSEIVRNHAATSDSCALLLLLVTNALFFSWDAQQPSSEEDTRRQRRKLVVCGVLLVNSVVQGLWLMLATRSYMHHRRRILLFNRWLRTLLAVSLAATVRLALTRRSPERILGPVVLSGKSSSRIPPEVDTFRHIMNASGSGLVMFYAVLYPLPFLQQLAMQALNLAILLTNGSVAHAILQPVLEPAMVRALCEGGNAVLDLVAVALSGTSPSARLLAQRCESDALHTLLLFANLYFGLVLPVYIAYRIEQQQKQAFIEALHLQADPCQDPRRSSFLLAAGYELLIGFLLAVQVWVLAVKLDPRLVHYPPAASLKRV